MDLINMLFSEENVRTLLLLVAIGLVANWQMRTFRQEMNNLGMALRREMDERFVAFHKQLKENDFHHLNETIRALTFTLQKNKIIEPMDKEFIDSRLDS